MPLVKPIVIPFDGDIKALEAKIDALDKDVDKFVAKNKEAAQASQNVAKGATMSWTDFRSAYSVALDAVRAGQQVWAATGGEFVKYAEQVKNLSRNIGVSAEDASRLIQIGDDVRISYDSMATAMKIAQKQGIDVSISGLEKLADKYKSLAPGVERTQFLMKTFGRSGLEMGKLLEQGGAGVAKMSAAIQDNLVLNEAAIKKSDEYQKSLDTLQDTVHGLSVEIGSALVPAASDILKMATADIQAVTDLDGAFKALSTGGLKGFAEWAAKIIGPNMPKFLTDLGFGVQGYSNAVDEAAQNNQDLSGNVDDNAAALDAQKAAVQAADDALKAYKDQLNSVSQANKDAESFMQSYADSQKKYVADHAAAVAELNKATVGGDSGEIEKAKKGVQDLEAQWHESTNKMIYDMVLAKVSVDGLTDAEFKATQDLAVSMGIRSQADADAAKAAMDKATSIADGIALQEDVMKEKQTTDAKMLELEQAKKDAADGTTTAVVDGAAQSTNAINNTTNATLNAINALKAQELQARKTAAAYAAIPASSTGGATTGKSMQTANASNNATLRGYEKRDGGGPGIAGQAYMINGGAKPEVFIPSTNGTFIPNADKKGIGGATYNIVINNPKKEAAENSIRSALKNLSYMGVAN